MFIEIESGALVRRFGLGPTLVCLHGFADNGSMFAPLAETYGAKQFSFVSVDLPGFGSSPRQGDVNTIDEFARWLNDLVRSLAVFESVGLIAHSVASAIAAKAIHFEPGLYAGLFSIEGNLTEADAYFSGQAAAYEDGTAFKAGFLDGIWKLAREDLILRRYFGSATMCDPGAMWCLGRDAKAHSANNRVGDVLRTVPVPLLYYWSPDNVPNITQSFIEENRVPNAKFHGASHWPTLDAPLQTSAAITSFFQQTRLTKVGESNCS